MFRWWEYSVTQSVAAPPRGTDTVETKSKRCGAFTTTQQPILSDDPHRLRSASPSDSSRLDSGHKRQSLLMELLAESSGR